MAVVICPNCGGENNVTNSGGQECAFCGSVLKDSKIENSSSEESRAELLGLFELDETYRTDEGVVNELLKFLANDDRVPVDFFDKLEVNEVNRFYLPMFRISGSFEADWSCRVIEERERVVGERPIRDSKGNVLRYETIYETYNEYIPQSGRSYGNFDKLIYFGEEPPIPLVLNKCFTEIDLSEIDGHLLVGDEVASVANILANFKPYEIRHDRSSESLAKFIKVYSNNIAKRAAEDSSFADFDNYDSPNVSYKCSVNLEKRNLFFVPFVKILYTYNGTEHQRVFMSSPSTMSYAPTVPEMDELDNPLEEMRHLFSNQSSSLTRAWDRSLSLSTIFTTFIGGAIFYYGTNGVYRLACERLYSQVFYLASIFFQLKRKDFLAKHGVDVEQFEVAGTRDCDNKRMLEKSDYDGSFLPLTLEALEEFFEETEAIRKKAMRQIRFFWFVVLSIIIFCGLICLRSL